MFGMLYFAPFRHGGEKQTRKQNEKYPEELKRKVVTEYATWEGSRGEFLAKYAIPNTALHQWLHSYHKPAPSEERQLAARAVHIEKLEAQLEKSLAVVTILLHPIGSASSTSARCAEIFLITYKPNSIHEMWKGQ